MQFQKGDPPGDQAGKEIRLDLDTNVFIFPRGNLTKLISFDRSLATAAPWKQKWILSDGFLLSRETRRHGINRIFQPEIITHDEGE